MTVLNTYLEALHQHGKTGVAQELKRIGRVTNKARRTKLVPPVSWELLCSIVPETFECHGHCEGRGCTVECRNTPPI